MAVASQSTRFGRIYPPDEAWLASATEEVVIEPALPIIDTHHHLWQRPDHRYLLHDLLDDLGRGHNVTATVFLQCHAMYRNGGPEEFRPVRGNRVRRRHSCHERQRRLWHHKGRRRDRRIC
jgi:L-fuconolactonase